LSGLHEAGFVATQALTHNALAAYMKIAKARLRQAGTQIFFHPAEFS
jgi:hypothetical protein